MEDVDLFYGHLVYFTAIWYILDILWLFWIFCGHFGYFMVIWYIFPRFGMLYKEKSGKPARGVYFLKPLVIQRTLRKKTLKCPWRRGAVNIASASGTAGPGSNPAGYEVFSGKVAMLS
jgi:hypothetical protein